MNIEERLACDGLGPDEDASIMSHMEWMREHMERLAWELEHATRQLNPAAVKLRNNGGSEK